MLELVDRSWASLVAACRTGSVSERYVEAHLAALRAAAALLAARAAVPAARPRSVWVLLPEVAPELAEWAAFFAAAAQQRAAAEAGSGRATEREADDLLRDAETFLGLVAGQSLGLPAAPARAARARG